MPHWSQAITDRIQTETHFDGREIKCFKDRPADLNAMLALARQGCEQLFSLQQAALAD